MLTQEQSNKLYIPTKEEFHTHYIGELSEEDFAYHPRNIAKKIRNARSFDKECLRQAKIRDGKLNRDNDTYSL